MNKKLYRTGPYADFFSQGVQVGNVLTLAGQLGDNEDGSVPDDIKGPTTSRTAAPAIDGTEREYKFDNVTSSGPSAK